MKTLLLMICVGLEITIAVANPSSCRGVFYEPQNMCYHYIAGSMTMEEGQQQCQNLGGRLAEIQDRATSDFVIDRVRVGEDAWIGIFDRDLNEVFDDTWVLWNELAVTWTNWDLQTNQPNNFPPVQECVVIRTSGVWQDRLCGEDNAALCEYKVTSICPATHSVYSPEYGVCYWANPTLNNFTDANYSCSEDGGHLAKIYDEHVSASLISMLYAFSPGSRIVFWFGVHRKGNGTSNDSYVNWDGSDIVWNDWANMALLGNVNQSCAALTYDNNGVYASWRTRSCDKTGYAVCEKEVQETLICDNHPNTSIFYQPLLTCYWVVTGMFDVTEAANECHRGRGSLAILYDANISQFVTEEFVKPCEYKKYFWISGYDNPLGNAVQENDWVDSNGDHLQWFDWYGGAANNNPPPQECIAIGYLPCNWHDKDCSDKYNAMCEAKIPDVCPQPGARLYYPTMTCYWLIKDQHNSVEAAKECSKHGGYLAELQNQYSTEFVVRHIVDTTSTATPCTEAWIGIFDVELDDAWDNIWVTGNGFYVTWTDWNMDTLQPNNNPSTQECVVIDNKCKWADRLCSEANGVLCERQVFDTPREAPPFAPIQPAGPVVLEVNGENITYWLEPLKATAFEAAVACAQVNGRLAVVDNQTIFDYIITELFNNSCPFAWIGIRDTPEVSPVWNNTWETWDGRSMNWTNWYLEQPNNSPPVQECVRLATDCRWVDRSCDDKYPFICEKKASNLGTTQPPSTPPITTITTTTTQPTIASTQISTSKETCLQQNALLFSETMTCFWFIPDKVTCTQAQKRCEDDGGYLAELQDQASTDFVLKHFVNDGQPDKCIITWIGIRDIELEDAWDNVWVRMSGSPLVWSDWYPHQPNNHPPTQECVVIGFNCGWEDKICTDKFATLCEAKVIMRQSIVVLHVFNGTEVTASPDSTAPPTVAAVYNSNGKNITYWLVSSEATAADAGAICAQSNGTLAVISSADISSFIKTNIFNDICSLVWIGIRDKIQLGAPAVWDNIWETWDGTNITWSNWYLGQPNNNPPLQECVRLSYDCRWTDRNCTDEYPFLCESIAYSELTTETTTQTSTTETITQMSTTTILPQTSTTEILAQTSTTEIIPQTSTTEIIPQTSTTDIIPQTSTTEIIPQTSTTEIIPQTSTLYAVSRSYTIPPECNCRCVSPRRVIRLIDTTPDRKGLSVYRRRLECAGDDRVSSAVLGGTAVLVIALIVLFVIGIDILSCIGCQTKVDVIKRRKIRR